MLVHRDDRSVRKGLTANLVFGGVARCKEWAAGGRQQVIKRKQEGKSEKAGRRHPESVVDGADRSGVHGDACLSK